MTRSALRNIWKRVGLAALQATGLGATKLLEFLHECGNTAPTLWANCLEVMNTVKIVEGGGDT